MKSPTEFNQTSKSSKNCQGQDFSWILKDKDAIIIYAILILFIFLAWKFKIFILAKILTIINDTPLL